MNYNQYLKVILPKRFWSFVRERVIMCKHRKIATIAEKLVKDCNGERLDIVKKVDFPNDKIVIWQYWAQGYGKDKMPPLVSMCLDSVEKYAATDYTIIRLSDENLSQYIDIPDWLLIKKTSMTIAHFADILRCMLLSAYGGLWLDASCLLTGTPPMYLFESEFFMYQRDPNEPNKEYWKHTFAYYFGWSKDFRVNVLNSIIYAQVGNKVISDICLMLMEFWKKNKEIPDYFFFQILFDVYIKSHPELNCPIHSDCTPHLLRQIINGLPLIEDVNKVKEITSLHSLNYKNPQAADRLREILS